MEDNKLIMVKCRFYTSLYHGIKQPITWQ